MIFPKSLQKGASIALVAPSGSVKESDLDFAIHWLESNDFVPVLSENLLGKHDFGYKYSGTIAERLSDFNWAISDPNIDAIWCARGGYGSVHLLDSIEIMQMKKKPKWIIGYSDITAFHQSLQTHGMASIHGVTAKQIEKKQTERSYQSLLSILTSKEDLSYEWSHRMNTDLELEGELVGGNLSILYSLIGTKYITKTEKSILFIEDWQENWYAIDRMLMNLILSGYMQQFLGILLGSFTKMDDKNENPDYKKSFDETTYKIIQERLKKYGIPIVFGFPAGHIEDNCALTMGANTLIKVKNNTALLIQSFP